MLAIPNCPVIRNRTALEHARDDKRNAARHIKCDGAPDQPLYARGWEDALVEEKKGHFEKRDLCKVDDLHKVEVLPERGDLVELERPNISADAIW